MELQVTLEDRLYSAIDYMHLHTKERLELLKGKLKLMSPSPGADHQRLARDISQKLIQKYSNSDYEVLFAPLDVFLNENTVVQPDIMVCRREQVSQRGCEGAPFLVVEVISPGTQKYDEGKKKELYREAGVKEYWLAYPDKIEKLSF
ncbi:MAG: Uma2 family endonuclease [Bacteroidota bacterium]